MYIQIMYIRRVIAFDWDDENREHLRQHAVSPEEFEQAISRAIDLDEYEHIDGEDRYHAIGIADSGRLIYMVYTPRAGKLRPVTAFTAGPKATEEWRRRNQ